MIHQNNNMDNNQAWKDENVPDNLIPGQNGGSPSLSKPADEVEMDEADLESVNGGVGKAATLAYFGDGDGISSISGDLLNSQGDFSGSGVGPNLTANSPATPPAPTPSAGRAHYWKH